MNGKRAFFSCILLSLLLAGCLPLESYATRPKQTPTPPAPTPTLWVDDDLYPTPDPFASPAPGEGGITVSNFQEPATVPKTVTVKVYKEKGELELYGDDVLLGTFPCITGETSGHKQKEGDKKTPEGSYYICSRNEQSELKMFMGLSYPNKTDARTALDGNVIKRAVYDQIVTAIDGGKRPPWNTAMGGAVGIHGKADGQSFTSGCIAVSDADVEILWKYLKVGTKVTIAK